MDEATKVNKPLSQLWETRDKSPTQQDFLLLAGLYKNLGKLGEQEEVLEKALELLKKGGGGPPGTSIRWTLQLTALKSSSQKFEWQYIGTNSAFSWQSGQSLKRNNC